MLIAFFSRPYLSNFCAFYSNLLTTNLKSCSVPASNNQPNDGGKFTTSDTAVGNIHGTITDYQLSYSRTEVTVPQDLAVGDKFCVAIAIYSRSSSSTGSFISKSTCTTSVKYPNLEVLGNHVQTNGKISTHNTKIPTTGNNYDLYGSWAELLIIAKQPVKGMSSGTSIIAKRSAKPNALCGISPLTISNSQCRTNPTTTDTLGSSNVTRDSIIEKLKTRKDAIESALTTYGGGSIIYRTGNYAIDSNIELNRDTTFYTASARNVPQHIIIVDGNINISEGVERIDAWLVASGNIDTCYEYTEATLNTGVCNKTLTINGPVIAGGKVLLKRTYGMDATGLTGTLNDYGEIINFTPESIIFGANNSTAAEPQLTYLRELAPRL